MSDCDNNVCAAESDRQKDRRGDVILAELLVMMREMTATINAVNSKLHSHMHDYNTNHDALEESLKRALHGFPNDDPSSHRMYHENVISVAVKRNEFWSKMVFELTRWGLIGFIGWAVWSLWLAFLHGPKQ